MAATLLETSETTLENIEVDQTKNLSAKTITNEFLNNFKDDTVNIKNLVDTHLQNNPKAHIDDAEKICEELLSKISTQNNKTVSSYNNLLHLQQDGQITASKYLQLNQLYKKKVIEIITTTIYEKNAEGNLIVTKVKKKYFR